MKSSKVHRAGYGPLRRSISFLGYVISSLCCHKQVIQFGYCWFPPMQIATAPLTHVLKSSEEKNWIYLLKT